jgi:hypothetical protein
MRSTPARGWIAFGLATAAVGWALLLFAWALYLPAYQGMRCGGVPETCSSSTATLVEANGSGVLFWIALPAAAAVLGWLFLHLACATRSRPMVNAAWVLVIALLAFSFVTGFSIGLFVFPVALLLGGSALLVDW